MNNFYELYMESQKYRGTSWVAVFRKNPDLEVLIGSRHDNSKVLPGGKLDKGESGKDAALRELEEETGISLRDVTKIGRWGKWGHLYATVLKREVKLKPNDDIKGLKWYSIEKLPDMEGEHKKMVMHAIKKMFKDKGVDEAYDIIPDAILNEEAKIDLKARLKELLKEKPRKQSGLLIAIEGIDGSGKCFSKGTKVLMFNGTTKNVEDVEVGDIVMGDDSTARKVISLHSGEDDLYKVQPKKGEAYVVNGRHVLSLKVAGKNKCFNKYHKGDGIVEIEVNQYLNQSTCWKRHMLGFRAGVDFEAQPVAIDPYFLGVWLGDGSTNKTQITTMDPEIVQCVCEEAESRGLRVTVYGSNRTAPMYNIVGNRAGRGSGNTLRDDLKQYGIFNKKSVPLCYKVNCRQVRLQILAGLLDTDGSNSKGCYDFVNKNRTIAEDVVWIARSLGFAAYLKDCVKTCQTGTAGKYFRVSISGNCDAIPVRIPRKKCPPRSINKDVLKVGIEVVPCGRGHYYGFETDGNHRFLLGDFTVVHNSTQIEELVKWLKSLSYDVVLTKWNSSDIMKKAIKKGKEKRMLTPLIFSLLHAADMAIRYEHEIIPALQKNKIVVCDRYIYTSLARDKVRGVNMDMLKEIYKGFRVPDALFHLKVPIETAFARVIKDKGLNYYSAGMDMNLSDNKEESCIKYEAMVDRIYDEILSEVPSRTKINGSKSIEEIKKKIQGILSKKFGIGRYK